MPTKSVGRREYAYAVVHDTAYTRPLRLKSEAANAFKSFRAAAGNESGSTLRAVMNDNARELSMGEVFDICGQDGIKVHTIVPYRPASNGVAERTIGVLTNAAYAMLYDPGLPDSLWAEVFNTATTYRTGHPRWR